MSKKLKKAVFVRSVDNNKVYLCGIDDIPEEAFLFFDEDDFYGKRCRFRSKKGDIYMGIAVSNILRMSEKNLTNLAKQVGGYYPLAPVIDIEVIVDTRPTPKLNARDVLEGILNDLDKVKEC